MRCAQGDMGDCLTAAARPAPRPITEREQSCLIAGYRIRAERRVFARSRPAGVAMDIAPDLPVLRVAIALGRAGGAGLGLAVEATVALIWQPGGHRNQPGALPYSPRRPRALCRRHPAHLASAGVSLPTGRAGPRPLPISDLGAGRGTRRSRTRHQWPRPLPPASDFARLAASRRKSGS
jgi:hypothetical protein